MVDISAHPLEELLGLEWLETNGIGGFAGSTVVGVNTRRYHGILVAATRPPTERMVLVSRLDEAVVTGTNRYELASREYPGAVHPDGHRFLRSFSRDRSPRWEIDAGGCRLTKRLLAIHGENTTIIGYTLASESPAVTLELKPFFAGRDYHALAHANEHVRSGAIFDGGALHYVMYGGVPRVSIITGEGSFHPEPDWYYRFVYRVESERGLDYEEDLFTPGVLSIELKPGEERLIAVTTQRMPASALDHLVQREIVRREQLVAQLPLRTPLLERLALAADQFIVRRDLPNGKSGKTIIAGYPWFTDWGRDTMIALPGLCLFTGRKDDAAAILDQFAEYTSEGMVPNRFPDGAAEPEYNSVDASLWFFVAVLSYVETTGDLQPLSDRWLSRLEQILVHYRDGTRFGIRADGDGLIVAGDHTTQLTWMDVKIGEWAVTPRAGKPVEVNALWVNAHGILARLYRALGRVADASELERRFDDLRERFVAAFWDEERGMLADCVFHGARDLTVRPNQIYALALPFPLLDGERRDRVLDRVREDLLTPAGLRSLAPREPHYRGRYAGGVVDRDSAYHQGTVWSFLIGPYVEALIRAGGPQHRRDAEEAIRGLVDHLDHACIGSVSEIFDGDAPYAPRGCPAQAWGVGELLRIVSLLSVIRLETPEERLTRAVLVM